MFCIERPTPEEAQVSLVGLSPDTRRLVTSPETVSQLSEMGVTVAVRGSASKGDLHLYMEGSAVGVDRGVVFIRREVSRSLEEANGVTRKGGIGEISGGFEGISQFQGFDAGQRDIVNNEHIYKHPALVAGRYRSAFIN
ncbi:hypothetical protein JL09_g5971 [Pichia kudriavzevii]|uniref:Uncharacterized protein n=1 Tax=Pichia kudriavzevii TaxID=4909 RepID=A0A099NQS7_PICKU|nr:hypothetical protein JL09_g5971 [Pichia kudriavzevii]